MQLKRYKEKTTRTNEQLVGHSRYLGPEVLKELAAKQLQAVWKDFLRLDPSLFIAAKKPIIKLSGYGNQRKFTAAAKLFLRLNPEIFTIVISTT